MAASGMKLLPPEAGPEEVCAFFRLDDAACARLALYVEELRRWNARMNLVAPSTLAEAWVRHVADGVQLLMHLPEGVRQVMDLGSGSGVPGLVMALAAPHRVRWTLVESNHRKCAFLRQVAQRAGIDVNIIQKRIESLDAEALAAGHETMVVARALAPLPRLLKMASALFATGASALLPKGRQAQDELAEARQCWQFDSQAFPSVTEADAIILLLQEIRRV